MKGHRIPPDVFKKICEYVPVCCVDVIVRHQGKVLLIKRERVPAKGLWWIPGGRIFKNEKLEKAALRKVREEVGLVVKNLKKVRNFYETLFRESPFKEVKTGTHTVNCVFVGEPAGTPLVRVDKDHSDYRWIDRIEGDLHPYIKRALRDSGVFG